MGMDVSTNSIAFCHYDGTSVDYGKLDLTGGNIFERIGDANRKAKVLVDNFPAEFVAIEQAVYINNRMVVIKLAMVYGSVIGVFAAHDVPIVDVSPMSWQNFIGNKNYTPVQKSKLIRDEPGRSVTWIKNEIRKRRKQYTMDWCNSTLGVLVDDADVADSCGIAFTAFHNLTRRD
jgi:Holliday junction resolvasome RuvABC endonuclease subunit